MLNDYDAYISMDFYDYTLPLTRPFICRAVLDVSLRGLGPIGRVHRSLCDSCRSLGCPSSSHHVPVKDWVCYPKCLENETI